MSSYIFIKNFYLEEIQNIIQNYFNSNYDQDATLSADILMKNSRTYFVQFNEELALEELVGWINTINQNKPINDRIITIEGYQTIETIHYKFYFVNDDIYTVNSNNETFKVEDLEELVPITSSIHTFAKTEIPNKNIHSMVTINYFVPKKKWWKFW